MGQYHQTHSSILVDNSACFLEISSYVAADCRILKDLPLAQLGSDSMFLIGFRLEFIGCTNFQLQTISFCQLIIYSFPNCQYWNCYLLEICLIGFLVYQIYDFFYSEMTLKIE